MSETNSSDDWLEDGEQWLEDEQLEGRAEPWMTFADYVKHNPGCTAGDWDCYRQTYWEERNWEDFNNAYYEDMSIEEYWERMESVDFL